jgi:hypothetical protein
VADSLFDHVAAKANLLRGRIVRFTAEAYTELSGEQREKLNLARNQLESMVGVAVGKAGDASKRGRIEIGYGEVLEAINVVVAVHGTKRESGNVRRA